MTYPQLLTISVVEPDDGTNLRCNLQREIGTTEAAKEMNLKRVGTIKSCIIAKNQQATNRRMQVSIVSNLPDQSHKGEEPVKIRRMEKLNTPKIEYGKKSPRQQGNTF